MFTALNPLAPSPVDRQFAGAMSSLFRQQAREILARTSLNSVASGVVPSLYHWKGEMYRVARPFVAFYWRRGMADAARRITQEAVKRGLQGRLWRKQLTRERRKQIGIDFSLSNPLVKDAVDRATLEFCETTNETARLSLEAALAKLREQLKEGLSRGEAYQTLTMRVYKIFADPTRAYRIALTEANRALNGGNLLAARESGVVTHKGWFASPGPHGSCPQCLKLDLIEVPIEEPFVIFPKGGPYAIVMHPPLHPGCLCVVQLIVGDTSVSIESPHFGLDSPESNVTPSTTGSLTDYQWSTSTLWLG